MKKTIALIPGDGIGPDVVAEAVKVLEEQGFRASLIDAMEACADISKKL